MAEINTATLLAIASVLLLSFLLGEIFERFGLESIIGYILAGLLLGPEVLDVVGAEALAGFGTIGATLILFQAGLQEENALDIFRNQKALDTGLGLLIGTFIIFFSTLIILQTELLPFNGIQAFVFTALAYSAIDLGVPSKTMLSRGLLRKDIGSYVLKSGVVNVTAAFIVLTGMILATSSDLTGFLMRIGGILLFSALFYLLHEFIHKIDDYVILFEEVESQFAITFAFLLSLAYLTELVGLSSVLGAFFAGVIISRSEFSESRAFQEKISAMGEGLFIPLFFAWFGLGLHLTGEQGIIANLPIGIGLFLLSIIPKLSIGYIMAYKGNIESKLKAASSFIALDIETIVILLIGIDLGVFPDHQILEIFAPSVILGTATMSVLYKISDIRE